MCSARVVVVGRADRLQRGRRPQPRRAAARRRPAAPAARARRAEAEVGGDAGGGGAQLVVRGLLVLIAPAPVLAPRAIGARVYAAASLRAPLTGVPATIPARPLPCRASRAGSGLARAREPGQSRSAGERRSSPPGGTEAADAALARAARARLAQPRRARREAGRLPADGSGLTLDLQPAAGRCGWSRRSPPARCRCCAWSAPPTGRGSPAAAPPGWRRGPGAGRSAPPDRSRSTRTRPHTMARELDEEWSVNAERMRSRRWWCYPARLVLLVGQAWLADGAKVSARPRARRLRVVAGDIERLARGGRRAASAVAELLRRHERRRLSPRRHLPPARDRLVHPLGGLPGAAASGVRARLAPARDVHPRPGPRAAVDRDVDRSASAPRGPRIIPFWLAVTVVVLGGLGPFAGRSDSSCAASAGTRDPCHVRTRYS